MEEITLLIDNVDRPSFDRALKSRNIEIVREEKVNDKASWITIQVSDPQQAFLLGESFGRDAGINRMMRTPIKEILTNK